MEKVKYNIAIQTSMEVFDFLIKNDLFVFDAGYDFLKSRISINTNGFIKETQSLRGNWDKNTRKELVPTMSVLNILMQNVDVALRTYDIPANEGCNYAQIGSNPKRYESYNEILNICKKMYDFQSEVNDTGKYPGMEVDFNLRQHPLELRKIECYSKLEEELKNCTYGLLMVDESGYPVDAIHRDFHLDEDGTPISDVPGFNFAKEDTYVNWDEFKEGVFNRYEYLLEEVGFNMREPYNNYKSVLGLEGRTK